MLPVEGQIRLFHLLGEIKLLSSSHTTQPPSCPGHHLLHLFLLPPSCYSQCSSLSVFFLFIFFFIFWLLWVFFGALGLSRVVVSKGSSLAAVHGLLIAGASLLAEHRL